MYRVAGQTTCFARDGAGIRGCNIRFYLLSLKHGFIGCLDVKSMLLVFFVIITRFRVREWYKERDLPWSQYYKMNRYMNV